MPPPEQARSFMCNMCSGPRRQSGLLVTVIAGYSLSGGTRYRMLPYWSLAVVLHRVILAQVHITGNCSITEAQSTCVGLTCRPQVVADVLIGRRGCREWPLTRVKTATMKQMLNISRTAAMRVLLRGFAAAGSCVPPAVVPKPMVPTVASTTAPHSAACSLSCSKHTLSNTY